MPRDTLDAVPEAPAGRLPGEVSAQTTHLVALLVFVFVAIIAAILATGAAGVEALSGIRAFVVGQANWTKAQKEAVYALSRYLETGDQSHYRSFNARLAVPRGDRKARLAMSGPDRDPQRALQGFLEGLTVHEAQH